MIILITLLLFTGAVPDARGPAGGASASVDSLSLGECYRSARDYFPLIRRQGLYDELAELQAENTAARLLPSLSASGQFLYQSDVPELPFQASGMTTPEVARDQYKAAVNVEQIVYDGGRTSAQVAAERAALDVESEQIEIEFHKRKERINEAYFGALLQEAALANLTLLRDEIQARMKALGAHVREGLSAAGRVEVLEVELLNIDQQVSDARSGRRASLAVLESLTGLQIGEETALLVPDFSSLDFAVEGVQAFLDKGAGRRVSGGRPEYRVFDLNRRHLERRRDLSERRNRPTVTSFATAAYGRPPGMNIFENSLGPYLSLGAAVRWPIWDWGSARRDRQMLALRKDVIDAQQETFTQGVRAVVEHERREAARLLDLLASDREIIRIRARIAERAAGELENGIISATDYVVEQHAEQQARLTLERHRIELAYARVRLLTTLGRTDEIP